MDEGTRTAEEPSEQGDEPAVASDGPGSAAAVGGARPTTWMDALDEMLDETVDREERVELVAEDLHVDIPTRMGEDAPRAEWRFDGTLRVDVEGLRGPLAEWLRLWEDRRATDGDGP